MSVLNIKGKELTIKEMAIIKTKSNIFYMKKFYIMHSFGKQKNNSLIYK